MILKAYEPDDTIQRLERRLAASRAEDRPDIERELRMRRAGVKGEREASYFIDFDFGASSNHAVIHNLRLEHEGLSAQIDHLVINRFYELTVLETKHFSSGLKIDEDGSFHRYDTYERAYVPIASPLAQAERHATLIARYLRAMTKRPRSFGLGFQLEPKIECYILVNTDTKIVRPATFDTSRVIASDRLGEAFNKSLDKRYGGIKSMLSLALLARVMSRRSLNSFGALLVDGHKPPVPLRQIPVVSARMQQPVRQQIGR